MAKNPADVTADDTVVGGNPNNPNVRLDPAQHGWTQSPEEAFYARENATNAGRKFRIQVVGANGVDAKGNPLSKTENFSYDTKQEQEEAADFLSAWCFAGVTPRRDSLEGGALVVISAAA